MTEVGNEFQGSNKTQSGVLEYWSNGVLHLLKDGFFPLLHLSITPVLPY